MQQQQYYATLGQLIGRVMAVAPTCPPTVAQDFINDRISQIFDRKPRWAGNIKHTTLYVPDPIQGGTVTMTQNSTTVIGAGLSWVVDDAVNTTLPSGIVRLGVQTVTPASMDGIGSNTLLYVDAAGDPEVVAVLEYNETSFTARFSKFHNPGCAMTCSSLVGRQLRLGNVKPVYSIQAIVDPNTLIIDVPWRAPTEATISYVIRGMYYTIANDIKSLISVTDPTQGIPPLRVNMSSMDIDRVDPQRSTTGYPQAMAARTVDSNGNQWYEIWPAAQSERQLTVIYAHQPPRLTDPADRIPPFINPTLLFNGALANKLALKLSADDIYYDPKTARELNLKFEYDLNDAVVADDDKNRLMYQALDTGMGWFGGAEFARTHSIDAILGNY